MTLSPDFFAYRYTINPDAPLERLPFPITKLKPIAARFDTGGNLKLTCINETGKQVIELPALFLIAVDE